jgi:ribonuclease BN (tRNA processing enzyme)/polynucleotide 5'-kinase involved in rRNA processing
MRVIRIFSMNQQISAEQPQALAEMLLTSKRRLLLLGPPGIGKTTLAATLAQRLSVADKTVRCLAADPGMPTFGLPGALNLGVWQQGKWIHEDFEALCSLDAARFRLPLIEAIGRLISRITEGILLIDAPGVVRGVAGAELLTSMITVTNVDLVAVLVREGQVLPLTQELQAIPAEVVVIAASPMARRPGKNSRDRLRTRLWDAHLAGASVQEISLPATKCLGAPPRLAPEAWIGKQVAFLQGDTTLSMGEVTGMKGETLQVRLPPGQGMTSLMLVRDAVRDATGLLTTSKRFADSVVRYIPPSDLAPDLATVQEAGYRPMVQTGSASALLMNGVFGDPLLHLRLAHQRRSLLFDLGEGIRLPARVAHQVSDIFISHAHMDHICGFIWLLRARIGEQSACRLFGPPGLADQIEHLINGIHWDRIGERGPRFEVAELHGERLLRVALQAGRPGRQLLPEADVEQGVVLDEPQFQVRAITLDHGIPVIAYAFEPTLQINVRKERLKTRGLEPGPWLTELKQYIAGKRLDQYIELPDGRKERTEILAAELTLITPGSKIVYATDLANSNENRKRLTTLAKDAHTLFCESPFRAKDAAQAQHTGHLTTTACGEIASLAQVRHLIPFHFSRRYEDEPWLVYDEIAAQCPQLVKPGAMQKTD